MSQQKVVAPDQIDDGQDGTALRRQRRRGRRADRRDGGLGWLGGVLLIGLGLLFMVQNAGYLAGFTNWWALFFLLPAAGFFSAALGTYRRNGRELTGETTGPLVGGLLFLGLTAVFLLNLSLSFFGPLLLIAGGLLLLLGRR